MSRPTESEYFVIGLRLRRFRRQAGLTQEQVGARLNPPMTRAGIANIETGQQRILVHTLLQLAAVVAVAPGRLLPSAAAIDGYRVARVRADQRRRQAARLRERAEAIENEVVAMEALI